MRIRKVSEAPFEPTSGQVVDSLSGNSTTNAPSINAINDRDTYSTSEKKVGYWIGGKPLYRKVINTGSLPNATSKAVASGISNLASVVSLRGIAHNPTSGAFIPLPYPSVTSTQVLMVYFSGGNVNFLTQNNFSAYTQSYVVIEYTKTTD